MVEISIIHSIIFAVYLLKSIRFYKEKKINKISLVKSVLGAIFSIATLAVLVFLLKRNIVSTIGAWDDIITFVSLFVLFVISNLDIIYEECIDEEE